MATYEDLLAALGSHLAAQDGLAGMIRGPYIDEVPAGEPPPEGEAPPYVVISQTGAGEEGRTSRGGFIDFFTYDFKVYHHDQGMANSRAKVLAAALDLFNKKPRPTFDDGSYLMSWIREAPMENKVPDSLSAGSRSLYRQVYTYRARVGGIRRAMVS